CFLPDAVSEATLESLSNDLNNKDLFELSGSELVESRLVHHQPGSSHYQVSFGPFETECLQSGDMLMIQGLEQFSPAVADLLTGTFSFLPRWRIEDVMGTLGDEGANCGPHFDHYDVFLLQIRGTKHWQISNGPFREDQLIADADLRLLADFPVTSSLLQRPGDLLYIPPGVGHHGIASDDSLTLSVGLRNPTLPELLTNLTDFLLDDTTAANPLTDGSQVTSPVITGTELTQLQAPLLEAISSPALSDWYGCYMTQLREPELIEPDGSYVAADLDGLEGLSCSLPTRLCRLSGDVCFVNGEAYTVSDDEDYPGWFDTLCTSRYLPRSALPSGTAGRTLLLKWLNLGALVPGRPNHN
ncbi:MAG: hypothetical protein KDI36_16925, partial [Pseudomonadales bacterium]|nr:hypothetical protein [Pseudomonadales bacterium]